MIITRAPFRVSFCGGGSDLPSFMKVWWLCFKYNHTKIYVSGTAQ